MKRSIRAVTTSSGTGPKLEHSIVESADVEFRSARLLRLFAGPHDSELRRQTSTFTGVGINRLCGRRDIDARVFTPGRIGHL